jgi:predicted ATPase with chaperone activity
VLRIARTIADLEGSARILERHLLEAVEHRRYGDGDFRWIRE